MFVYGHTGRHANNKRGITYIHEYMSMHKYISTGVHEHIGIWTYGDIDLRAVL